MFLLTLDGNFDGNRHHVRIFRHDPKIFTGKNVLKHTDKFFAKNYYVQDNLGETKSECREIIEHFKPWKFILPVTNGLKTLPAKQ